jgi:hypothetical protein
LGGATGPVTVGTVTSSPSGVTVNASSISVEVQGQVATVSMNVTVPVNSGSGSSYYSLSFPVSAPGVSSQTAGVSISVPPTGVTPVGISMAGPVLTTQGNSWTFPITITPLGGATGVNLYPLTPNQGIILSSQVYRLALDGVNPLNQLITIWGGS